MQSTPFLVSSLSCCFDGKKIHQTEERKMWRKANFRIWFLFDWWMSNQTSLEEQWTKPSQANTKPMLLKLKLLMVNQNGILRLWILWTQWPVEGNFDPIMKLEVTILCNKDSSGSKFSERLSPECIPTASNLACAVFGRSVHRSVRFGIDIVRFPC